MCRAVAKASSGLIPQPFLIRVLNKSKRTINKKGPSGWDRRAWKLFHKLKQISPPVAGVAYTCNRGKKYVERFGSLTLILKFVSNLSFCVYPNKYQF